MARPVKKAYTAFDGSEIKASDLELVIIKKKIGSADELARLAAPKTAQIVYNALRVGPRLILRSAFELLRANMVTRIISVVVLLAMDKFNFLRGKISFKQFVINVILALMLLLGGTAGWMLGSHALGMILESLILGIIAGIIGAGLLSAVLSFAINKVIHLFVTDDTEDMLAIYSQEFAALAQEHRLNLQEVSDAKSAINMCKQMVRDLFIATDKPATAKGVVEPHIMNEYEKRRSE